LLFAALAPATAQAQKPKAAAGGGSGEDQPAFSEFKGVRLGMTTEESRKKLGSPRDKSVEQDFYIFNDTEAVQVFYDKKGAVSAIAIDYMNGSSGIPSAKDVLGTSPDAKPDGSIYQVIRYEKAGYWVSYSRTAGNSPTVTVTMQKIDR
jgi:hypothetical protein